MLYMIKFNFLYVIFCDVIPVFKGDLCGFTNIVYASKHIQWYAADSFLLIRRCCFILFFYVFNFLVFEISQDDIEIKTYPPPKTNTHSMLFVYYLFYQCLYCTLGMCMKDQMLIAVKSTIFITHRRRN